MHYTSHALDESGRARLDCYVLDAAIAGGRYKTRPALLIAPGGAYLKLAQREAEPVAMRFAGLGYQVFVLRYPTYVLGEPVAGTEPQVDHASHQPAQTIAAMRAMAFIRAHAAEWDIDASRVYALGFSAGANVVGLMCERFDDAELLAQAGIEAREVRPDGLLLCYPMVSADLLAGRAGMGDDPQAALYAALVRQAIFGCDEPSDDDYARVDLRRHVRPDLPRTFVWQTSEDVTVSPDETIDLVGLLHRAGVPVEFHLFERGPHGMGLADPSGVAKASDLNAEAAAWVELAARWLALDASSELSHA
jgi:acetyl esterase/lipase